MVTVCKKWRVSYTEARKLVNDYDNGDVPFPRYAAIGPASNLCEALGERNSALHQGNDDQVVEPLTDYTNPDGHTVWQTVYNDIEHCLREQVSVEVNRFHSNIQQVISDQFNSSQCAGIVGEPYVSVGTEDHSGENTVFNGSQGGESCPDSYSTYATCQDNSSICDNEEGNQLTYYYSQQSVEHQIDQTLLTLQSCALFISNVLRRSEYSTKS